MGAGQKSKSRIVTKEDDEGQFDSKVLTRC
jgi:hypothetical protein